MQLCSKTVRVVLLLSLALVVIAAIIAIVVTLVPRDSSGQFDASNVCTTNKLPVLDSYASMHHGCRNSYTLFPYLQSCPTNTYEGWRRIDTPHGINEGLSDGQRSTLPFHTGAYSLILLSPFYNMSSRACSLRISVNIPNGNKSEVVVYSPSDRSITYFDLTPSSCNDIVIDDSQFLSKLETFEIIVLSNSAHVTNELQASVTSQFCYNYQSIDTEPTITQNPTFDIVPTGRKNHCSSEIKNGSVHCDWYIVEDLGNEKFTRKDGDDRDCISKGVGLRPEDSAVWYLSLNGTHPETRGYLISPILNVSELSNPAHLLLSFWYIAQCNQTKIRVYVIPAGQSIASVKDEIPYNYEVKNNKSSFDWVFQALEIPVSSSSGAVQVVIEGVMSSEGNCTGHLCYLREQLSGSANYPVLAIDEMTVEIRFDSCNVTEGSPTSLLDCSFQREDGSSSYCAWVPSSPVPSSGSAFWKVFAEWKTINVVTDFNPEEGATTGHLEGRGFILTFKALSSGSGNHIRSPVLVSNSNCSCRMFFTFLLRGAYAPRLQVNILLGNDPGPRVLDKRIPFPLWSVFGHQSDNWVNADVTLNLPTTIPFQVEIQARDLHGPHGEANLDDLLFRGCDFSRF